jgi:hypothetical protein
MGNTLQEYAADHRYLLEVAARQAGFAAPVAIDLDEFQAPLLKLARKGEIVPLDGVLVRDWDPDRRRGRSGLHVGLRMYQIEGVRFACVECHHDDRKNMWGLCFYAVDRKDYHRLYRIAKRCRRDSEPSSPPPVLPAAQAEVLWKNTIGYLEPANLRRIKQYGGRAKRGVLLMGPPGNGKTSVCRWLWEECRRRGWTWRIVTPDAYNTARSDCDAEKEVKKLFTVEGRGIVFFDDMDLALRDRDTVNETDDQSVFLGALDGISINEGVVFVFTTNCDLALIDRAFKRPGRIDLVLRFDAPTAELRRLLLERWHPDIRANLDADEAVVTTKGYSFAEIEELKNLLILHFLDDGEWDWHWALDQFALNRTDLAARHRRRVGFGVDGLLVPTENGE